MRFEAHNFPVSPTKIESLRKRIEQLHIQLNDIEETFTKGSGKGGQKINKTSSTVCLKYAPLNLIVKMSKDRSQSLNRFLALRELVDQIEMKISPQTSDRLREWEKIRKQKNKSKNRSPNI